MKHFLAFIGIKGNLKTFVANMDYQDTVHLTCEWLSATPSAVPSVGGFFRFEVFSAMQPRKLHFEYVQTRDSAVPLPAFVRTSESH